MDGKRMIRTYHEVPYDLIVEILSRVSVKSLLRFRCVSKQWLSVISCQEFIKTHLKISSNNKEYTHHRIIAKDWNIDNDVRIHKNFSLQSCIEEPVTHATELLKPCVTTFIVGSCNGVICLTNYHGDIYLWNPSIRKSKKLPRYYIRMRNGMSYGFGYNELDDDYIVVAIYHDVKNTDEKNEVNVYSLKAQYWRRIDGIPGGYPRSSGKFVNGKLHWICRGSRNDPRKDYFIVSLDLGKSQYERVEMPKVEARQLFARLRVLGGCLCIISTTEVWVMKVYGVKESWTKIQMIPSPHSIPLCILKDGEIVELTSTFSGTTLTFYSPDGASLRHKRIMNIRVKEPLGNASATDMYVESLVPL